jgi:NTE family protein
VRLLAPRLANEDHTKDVDFSPSGIRKRWEAGYADTLRAIDSKPWQGNFDPLEGVILHEHGNCMSAPKRLRPSEVAVRALREVPAKRRAVNAN